MPVVDEPKPLSAGPFLPCEASTGSYLGARHGAGKPKVRVRLTGAQEPASPRITCVTLSKPLTLSEPLS